MRSEVTIPEAEALRTRPLPEGGLRILGNVRNPGKFELAGSLFEATLSNEPRSVRFAVCEEGAEPVDGSLQIASVFRSLPGYGWSLDVIRMRGTFWWGQSGQEKRGWVDIVYHLLDKVGIVFPLVTPERIPLSLVEAWLTESFGDERKLGEELAAARARAEDGWITMPPDPWYDLGSAIMSDPRYIAWQSSEQGSPVGGDTFVPLLALSYR